MNKPAPIVLFVYNRPKHTLKTLEALKDNLLANESTLFIYADGPKLNCSLAELDSINQTRSIARSEKWCSEVILIESDINKGLAQSIKDGVTQIVERFGRAIILEDDILTSPYFIKYMNDALNLYEHDEKVMHVSAYLPFTTKPKHLPSTFFLTFMSCWGWATWKRAWDKSCWDYDVLLDKISSPKVRRRYNLDGAIDFDNQLLANKQGKLKTWAIFWFTSIFVQKGLCLFPGISLVENIGFDGSGNNCENRNEIIKMNYESAVEVNRIKIAESKIGRRYLRNYYIMGNQYSIYKYLKFYLRSLCKIVFGTR